MATTPWRGAVGRFASACVDVVASCGCVVCGGTVAAGPGRALCGACEPIVDPGRERCRRCGATLGPRLPAVDECPHCVNDRLSFQTAYALGNYDGRLREAVVRAKTRGGPPVAGHLARLLVGRYGDALRGESAACVTAVPRHWTRRLATDHDAADVIARVVAGGIGVAYRPGLLVQYRRSGKQAGTTRTARKAALGEHFRVGRRAAGLDGATVILCDDVLTTGTTASRCAKVLRDAGVGRVVVVVLARSTGP
ncbi:MAG: phosphoribosyltransferase family protein [Planctomycetota bacterium]